MPSINYTSSQTQQIADLKMQIEAFCQANGVDSTVYTKFLDGKAVIDKKLLDDPAFQAYWQLAYLQLMEILYPTLVQSLNGDIEDIKAAAGSETNKFIRDLVLDNPELLAFAALRDQDPATNPEAVRALVEQNISITQGQYGYVDDEARELLEKNNLGPGYEWLINTEEGIHSMDNWIISQLADMDQQLFSLTEALQSGQISAEAFKAKTDASSASRQLLVGLMQQGENQLNNLLTMFTNLIKQEQDTKREVVRHFNVNA